MLALPCWIWKMTQRDSALNSSEALHLPTGISIACFHLQMQVHWPAPDDDDRVAADTNGPKVQPNLIRNTRLNDRRYLKSMPLHSTSKITVLRLSIIQHAAGSCRILRASRG